MPSERRQKIETLFQTATDLSVNERAEYLAENCADDAEIRREVEILLERFDAENFAAKNELDSMEGKIVGSYRILKEIGRGGMGAVYSAERADGIFRTKAAIKLIKRGMDTDSILRRFRNERQILAALSHPNVARLLDGGTTSDGLPYFVMEYIDGKTLFRFCDENNLNIKARLEIFRQICEAVQQAHNIKVVHRDLKPSNILVKPDGTPKLLDFGIAKLLDPELASATIEVTMTQWRLMTPQYASPEQICGGEITFASDVYSLGVLLYELVTGAKPYHFKSHAPHEISRVVCEQEAEPIADSGLQIIDLNLDNLNRIVLKALRKVPSERYQTAYELSADIESLLKNLPVSAESFVPANKQTKTNGENKHSIAILPFKLLNLNPSENTGGDDYLSLGLADALVSRLSGIKRLLVRPTSSVMRFGNESDAFGAGHDLKVDFIVEGNIRRVGERIRVTTQLFDVKANSTRWADKFDEHFTDVLELEDTLSERVAQSLLPQLTGEERQKLDKRGTNSPEAYEAFLRGRVYWNMQTEEGFARAIGFYQQAVAHDSEYAQAWAAIAEYYIFLGIHCVLPFSEGANAAREAAEKAVRTDPTLAEGYAALGFAAITFELDWQKADALFQKAVELNSNSITAHFWYVALLAQTRRFDEALEQIRQVLKLDPTSLLAVHMRAWVLYHSRSFAESIGIHRKMLETDPNYPWGLQTFSWVLRQVGQFDEAVAQAERAVQLTGKNPFYLTSLAAAYAEAGEREKTFEILAKLDEMARTRFVSEYMLALVYCALGDKDRAFENLEKSMSARDGWMNWMGVEPQFDVLRGDPRFAALLRRTGSLLAERDTKPTAETGAKSIAVLPLKLFGTPTGSPEDEFLGIGLADALTTRLSNVRRIVVRPTSSVLQLYDANANPFRAGQELNVDYILNGSIRRAGERIRVTIQLLNVAEKSSRWAENFNEKFTDVLEVEDSISEKVVKSLLPRLTGEEEKQIQKRGTNSPEAYEAHLRGRFYWNQFTPESLLKAKEAFENAVRLDPDYALAYVDLADFYIWGTIYGMIPSLNAINAAETALLRAVEIDDQLGEAYASLGLINQNRKRWSEAEKFKHTAIEYSPNYVHAHEWAAAQYVGLGRTEEGIREILIAEKLDPLSLRTKTLVGWTLFQAHRFEECLQRGRQIIDLDKNYPQGYSQIGLGLYGLRRFGEALPNFQKFDEMIPDSALTKYQLCFGLVKTKRFDEAAKVLQEINTLAQNAYVKPFFLAMANAALGNLDEAFAFFEQAFAEDEPWMLWLGTEPMLENVHGDARFLRLLEKMNNPLAGKFRKTADE